MAISPPVPTTSDCSGGSAAKAAASASSWAARAWASSGDFPLKRPAQARVSEAAWRFCTTAFARGLMPPSPNAVGDLLSVFISVISLGCDRAAGTSGRGDRRITTGSRRRGLAVCIGPVGQSTSLSRLLGGRPRLLKARFAQPSTDRRFAPVELAADPLVTQTGVAQDEGFFALG